jgi:hypothetical protein
MVGERQTNKMTFRQKKEELLTSLRGIGLKDPPTEVWVWVGETKVWGKISLDFFVIFFTMVIA